MTCVISRRLSKLSLAGAAGPAKEKETNPKYHVTTSHRVAAAAAVRRQSASQAQRRDNKSSRWPELMSARNIIGSSVTFCALLTLFLSVVNETKWQCFSSSFVPRKIITSRPFSFKRRVISIKTHYYVCIKDMIYAVSLWATTLGVVQVEKYNSTTVVKSRRGALIMTVDLHDEENQVKDSYLPARELSDLFSLFGLWKWRTVK